MLCRAYNEPVPAVAAGAATQDHYLRLSAPKLLARRSSTDYVWCPSEEHEALFNLKGGQPEERPTMYPLSMFTLVACPAVWALVLLAMISTTPCFGQPSGAGRATVTVNVDHVTADISPLIYGQFIEHAGRAIYSGIYEANSPLSDSQGFRKDVMAKVKALGAPVMRYPGGTVTKIYHWQDGIGPKDQRPVRRNLIWGGEDTNHVGTDEFIAYCDLIGAAPFLTVNMSTGTAEEASNWVEYCNARGNSYYSALRGKNGHTAPYGVKYWGLGNEEAAKEDAGILQDPARYAEKAWYYAKLMKLQDPSIELIVVGEDEHWNKTVLESLGPVCDYLSLHLYAGSQMGAPYSLFASVRAMEEKVTNTAAQIKALTPVAPAPFSKWYRFPGRKGAVKLAIDEWGIWEANGHGPYGLEQTYTWNHALAVASFLNLFQRHADVIGMATWAQTVNVLAPLMTNEKSVVCQTIYHPMALYRQFCGGRAVASTVACDALPESGGVPMLDVSSSIDGIGETLSIAVVNRSATEPVDVELKVDGAKTHGQWTAHELNAQSIQSVNTLADPTKDVVQLRTYSSPADTRRHLIPAHSITIFRVGLAK